MRRIDYRRILALLLLAGTIVGLYYFADSYLSLEALAAREAMLRQAVAAYPLRTLTAVFVTYVLLTLIPGLAGKSVIIGWLIGFWPGLMVVNVGLTVAALAMFLLSRYLLGELVQRKLGWFVSRLNRMLRENDSSYLLGLRLLHAPYTLTNYGLGVTNVGVRRFWWTTQLGILPGNIAFVLAGASLPSLEAFAQQGLWSFVNAPLFVGLTLMGLLPLVVRWCNRCFGGPPVADGLGSRESVK